jgi:CheY-like chemotaxis protein
MIGDDVRLSQVFRNVISNALKFTPPDGTIEVTASHVKNGLPGAKPIEGEEEFCITHPRAGSIRIAVKDSGVGLTKDQLQQLFGEGVQFDANRLQHGGGSGLGLNIAKGLVEQHQGTIRAESEGNGHGTTFIIELPLYEFTMEELKKDDDKDSTSQPTATTATLSTTKEERVFPPSRILVAEDAASSRKMLIRLLERSGHTCVPATNGQEALTAIEADMQVADPDHIPIDTILMDFEMPLLTGPEATKIWEMGYKGIIIGVTGNVLEEDVKFFKDHGADQVFSKPVSMEIIKAYLERQ